MRVVLDTNIILASISRFSPYSPIIDALIDQQYELVVTNEILLEYEERLIENFDDATAKNFINAQYNLPNVFKVNRIFASELIIADLDGNKFVDAYYSGGVHHLVTNDKHFNILKRFQFPEHSVLRIEAFIALLTRK
ncbi:MAG TPA: putative toxin-antitoxin system toxin component, PIN family [Parafilimonas sp.]|nr:putative toxin-antitoxin system toxin component, PIN family [Parafilimonas sp.]